MKRQKFALAIAAAVGLWFSTASNSATATPITGQLDLVGHVTVDTNTHLITFLNAITFGGSGSFSGFPSGVAASLYNQGTAKDYNTLNIGSDLTCGAGCLFEVTSGGTTASFNLQSESVTLGDSFTLTGSGILSLTGFDDTQGIFQLTTQLLGEEVVTNVSFSATTLAVPGPVVGAGLPGLILACSGILALRRRRRASEAVAV